MQTAGVRTGPLKITAVVPVREGRRYLQHSLIALLEGGGEALDEVIVVDDGMSPESRQLALAEGVRIVPSGGSGVGPASGRNVGVAHAHNPVVLFVDADVVLHPGAVDLVAEAFADPHTTAVFGAYDDAPPDGSFASQYMNLRHHFGHRVPSDDAKTFWSGIGAVRVDAFLSVGGFDGQAYPRPSIEDIDLGRRLRAAGGRIRRVPQIRGTHLKRWTLAQVIKVDIFHRAIPWTQLMLRYPGAFDDLNVKGSERLKALLAAAFTLSLVASLFGALSYWIPAVLLIGAFISNRELATLFLKRRGPVFMLAGLLFHQLYYHYSSAVFVSCFALDKLRSLLGGARGGDGRSGSPRELVPREPRP